MLARVAHALHGGMWHTRVVVGNVNGEIGGRRCQRRDTWLVGVHSKSKNQTEDEISVKTKEKRKSKNQKEVREGLFEWGRYPWLRCEWVLQRAESLFRREIEEVSFD